MEDCPMRKISLEKQIYLCKYHEIDTLGFRRKEINEILDDLKKKGLYEKYRNMPEEEYEKVIREEKIMEKYKSAEEIKQGKEPEKNNLMDLNDILFEHLRKLNSDDLTQDELDNELKISKQVVSVSQTIINNASLLLSAQKHFEQTKSDNSKIAPLLRLDK